MAIRNFDGFEGVAPGTPVRVALQVLPSAPQETLDCAVAVFELFCLLGGLGRRSRRGFGVLQPATWWFADAGAVRELVGERIRSAQRAVEAFADGAVRSFGKSDLPTPFPVPASGAVHVRVGKERWWQYFIKDLMQKIHDNKQGGMLKENVLGGIRPRRASTMIVSVVELGDDRVAPVFTNFISKTATRRADNPLCSDFDGILAFPAKVFDARQDLLS